MGESKMIDNNNMALNKKSNNETTLEVKRQFFHLFLGLFITFVVYNVRPVFGPLVTVSPLMLAIVLMLIIPRMPHDLTVMNHLLLHFERTENIENFPFKGAFWYGLGFIPPILFLHIELACAVIIVISVGDSISTLIGIFYGKHKVGGYKSIEGFLAFVVSSFLGAAIFVSPEIALTLAVFGGLMELFITKIDDNLAIPLGLTLLYLAFQNFESIFPI